jgi:hypothetical protein
MDRGQGDEVAGGGRKHVLVRVKGEHQVVLSLDSAHAGIAVGKRVVKTCPPVP